MKSRQFKKITVAQPKGTKLNGGCAPGAAADPDAPPC